MALWLLIGLVVSASVKSSSEENEDEDSMMTSSSTTFTDQWAVHIDGGDDIANAIAARHGFTNLGKVCTDFSLPRSFQSSDTHTHKETM